MATHDLSADGLAAQLRLGNPAALKILHADHYAALCRFSLGITGDLAESQDIATTAFLKYWNKCSDFNTVAQVKSYLYSVAESKSKDAVTRAKRQAPFTPLLHDHSIEHDDTTQRLAIQTEIINSVYIEIKKLPASCRTIFIMAYVKKIKAALIAKQLGISVNTVKAQKARALKKLRNVLPRQKVLLFVITISILQHFAGTPPS